MRPGRIASGAAAIATLLLSGTVFASPSVAGDPRVEVGWDVWRATNPEDTLWYAATSLGIVHVSANAGVYAYYMREGEAPELAHGIHLPGEATPIFTGKQLLARGGYVYVVNMDRKLHLLAYDPADGYQVVPIDEHRVMERGMAVTGQYLFTTYHLDFESHLRVFDLTNPASLRLVAQLDFDEHVCHPYIFGSWAFVTLDRCQSIAVINISEPDLPELATVVPIGSSVYGIVASGNNLFVSSDGLILMNLSDPTQTPVRIPGTINEDFQERFPFVNGRFLYLAAMQRRSESGLFHTHVLVCDISHPMSIECSDSFILPTANPIVDYQSVDDDSFLMVAGDLYYVQTYSRPARFAEFGLIGGAILGVLGVLMAVSYVVHRKKDKTDGTT